MRLLFVFTAVASLLSDNLALPVGKEGQREDEVARCLVEVLTKAVSKPDSQLDQECKDILYAGVKHAPVDKKSSDGAVAQEEGVKGQAEVPGTNGADVKDIEALLKSVGEKRETPEDERSQESWSLGDGKEGEREKRSSWRPGRFHQRKHKRDEEMEEDFDRSQESWGVDKRSQEDDEEEIEKRGMSWRPRYQQRKQKRDEEPLSDEEDDERSQEAWDVDKRIWKPTHRYHHKKKLHKRGEEEDYGEHSQESWGLDDDRDKRSWRPGRFHQRRQKRDEEQSDEVRDDPNDERSQEYWDFDGREKREWRPGRYHQRRHKRDEELSEEARDDPNDERSQEYWDFDGREKREWKPGRYHQRRHKRDEEFSDEARDDPNDERSQEYWDFDIDKRDWRAGRYHQRRHKRGEEQEEEEGDRSQEYWGVDKRNEEEGGEIEKRIWKPTHRYHHKKKLHKRDGGSFEEQETADDDEEAARDKNEALRYLAEKRNPWIYRGYYHPAWFKRSSDRLASGKMEELAKLLSYKINQLANHSDQDEVKRSMPQRTISPQEEKQLQNLAAMDMELQKIAAKLHDNTG